MRERERDKDTYNDRPIGLILAVGKLLEEVVTVSAKPSANNEKPHSKKKKKHERIALTRRAKRLIEMNGRFVPN